MNTKLETYLLDQLSLINRIDTDRNITERKRFFNGQRDILTLILTANMNGEFDG